MVFCNTVLQLWYIFISKVLVHQNTKLSHLLSYFIHDNSYPLPLHSQLEGSYKSLVLPLQSSNHLCANNSDSTWLTVMAHLVSVYVSLLVSTIVKNRYQITIKRLDLWLNDAKVAFKYIWTLLQKTQNDILVTLPSTYIAIINKWTVSVVNTINPYFQQSSSS